MPDGYRIVDSNSPMLAALVARDGGEWHGVTYLPDCFEVIREALAAANADVLLITGGTSVGAEDHTPAAVATVGELAVHGIAMRPAAPTGIGFLPGGRVAFLLPGNPVACLCAYDLFAGRLVRRLGGQSENWPYRVERVPAAVRLGSQAGRLDYVRVRLHNGAALPVPGGASRLSTVVEADGFVLIEPDQEAIEPGQLVNVYRYD
jgi:molybdopterin molybdotransferase